MRDSFIVIGGPLVGGGESGGVTATEWQTVSSVKQAAGAVYDPNSMSTTGTVFSGSTFTFNTNPAHATIQNGYRSDLARWTVNILEEYPDFDPDTDLIQIRINNITGFSAGGADGFAVFAGVLSEDTDDIANCDGTLLGLRRLNSTPTIQCVVMARTGLSSSNNISAALDQFAGTTGFYDGGSSYSIWGSFGAQTQSTTTYQFGANSSGGGSMGTDTSSWCIHIGVAHFATTTATLSFTWTVDTRILKTTGI